MTVSITLALLLPVLLPFLVSFHPEVFLDVDPRVVEQWSPATAFGPTGMSWLHTWAIVAAGAGLAVALWRGAVVCWLSLLLAGIGIGFCLWHMGGPMDNRLRVGAWLAAICLGLAGLHLGQFKVARRWWVAALVAMLIPVFLDAMGYVLVEHPALIDDFMSRHGEVLGARGWAAGSAKALKYEQRLRASDVTGAFGLSNILASLTLALSILSTALTIGLGLLPKARAKWWLVIPGVLTGMGLVTIWLTHSRGALLILPVGLVLILLSAWVCGGEKAHRLKALPSALVFGFIALVITTVLVTGMIGPANEPSAMRSLLFRFHYWHGAFEMLTANAPTSWLIGMSPAGFEHAYPRFKPPISPEDVISTHNVWLDYVTMLGLGGWAWCVLLGLWLGKGAKGSRGQGAEGPRGKEAEGQKKGADEEEGACRPIGHDAQGGEVDMGSYKPDLIWAAGLAGVVFGIQYWVTLPELTIEAALLWLLGMLGFIGVATALVRSQRAHGEGLDRWVRIGLFAAAACLLIHSQIAMTFFNLASTMPAWFIMGLAAAPAVNKPGDQTTGAVSATGPPIPKHWLPWLVAAAMLGLGLFMVPTYAIPISAEQGHVANAARLMRLGRPQQALQQLRGASRIIAVDKQPFRYRMGLAMHWAKYLYDRGDTKAARQRLDSLLQLIERAQSHGLSAGQATQNKAQVYTMIAQLFDDTQARSSAVQATLGGLKSQPNNPQAHLHGADRLRRLGRTKQAKILYRQALKRSEEYYLDPLAQLSKSQRQRAERLANATTADAEPRPLHPAP